MCSAGNKTHSAVGDTFLQVGAHCVPTVFSPSFDMLRFHAKTTHCCAQIAFLASALRTRPGKAAREIRAQRQGVLRATSRERHCSWSVGSPSPGRQPSRSFASEFFPARLSPLEAGGQGEPTHAGEGETGRGAPATPAAQRGSAGWRQGRPPGSKRCGPAGPSWAAGLSRTREARTTVSSAQDAAAEPLHRRPADSPSTAPLRAKLRRRERALGSASLGRGKLPSSHSPSTRSARTTAILPAALHRARHCAPRWLAMPPPRRLPPPPGKASGGGAATGNRTLGGAEAVAGNGEWCSRRRICRHRPRQSRAAGKPRRPPSLTNIADEDRARKHSAGQPGPS